MGIITMTLGDPKFARWQNKICHISLQVCRCLVESLHISPGRTLDCQVMKIGCGSLVRGLPTLWRTGVWRTVCDALWVTHWCDALGDALVWRTMCDALVWRTGWRIVWRTGVTHCVTHCAWRTVWRTASSLIFSRLGDYTTGQTSC